MTGLSPLMCYHLRVSAPPYVCAVWRQLIPSNRSILLRRRTAVLIVGTELYDNSEFSVSFIRPGFDPLQRQRIFLLTSASRPALGPTQPPVHWVPGALSPGVKRGRGVMLTTHPLLVPRLRKSVSCTSCHPDAPLWSVTGPLYLLPLVFQLSSICLVLFSVFRSLHRIEYLVGPLVTHP
jgi:hypothetical protein